MFEGQFTGTPEIGLGLSEAGRDYSLGWRLTRAGSGAGSLEFSLEARRRESANDDVPPRARNRVHRDRALVAGLASGRHGMSRSELVRHVAGATGLHARQRRSLMPRIG